MSLPKASAAAFERGNVLRSLIVALERTIQFAAAKKVEVEWRFPSLLVHLISRRPSVYAEAIDAFLDLRTLAVNVVHDEFARFASTAHQTTDDETEAKIQVNLHKNPFAESGTVRLPLSVMRSTAVLLSTWKDEYSNDEKELSSLVSKLVGALMRTKESPSDAVNDSGLSDVANKSEDSNAVPVELVSIGIKRLLLYVLPQF